LKDSIDRTKGKNMIYTTRDQVKSPPLSERDEHDWRKEPWVKENYPDEIDMIMAYNILVALSVMGENDGDPQSEEDMQVFMLLRPDLCERIAKSEVVDEAVRHRTAQALAQSLKMTRSRYLEVMAAKGVQL
jgi:hypothetical protein